MSGKKYEDSKVKPQAGDSNAAAKRRLNNALAAGEISKAEYDQKMAQLNKGGSGTNALKG